MPLAREIINGELVITHTSGAKIIRTKEQLQRNRDSLQKIVDRLQPRIATIDNYIKTMNTQLGIMEPK